MKYLDRHDWLEIGIIALIVIGVLMLVTGIILMLYAISHFTPPGCVPHVTL